MKFLQVLKVWWAFIWRYVGTLFIAGALYGMFFGATPEEGTLLGNILALPLSFLYFYYVLNKYFGKKKEKGSKL